MRRPQLEAVVLHADGAHRLAVLLVEERVGPRSMASAIGRNSTVTVRVVADNGRTSSSMLRFSSSLSARSNVSRSGGIRLPAIPPASPSPTPPMLRSARWRMCVPVWLRIVGRAGRHRPPPSRHRLRRRARGGFRGARSTLRPACPPRAACPRPRRRCRRRPAARRGRRFGRRPRDRTACGRARSRRRPPRACAAPRRPWRAGRRTRCHRGGSRRPSPPCSSPRTRRTWCRRTTLDDVTARLFVLPALFRLRARPAAPRALPSPP